MADQYQTIRATPLITVFSWLGVDTSQFKQRKGKNGAEYYGKCIYHDAKTNNTSFSFTADLAHCFSCNLKFRGAIDAVKEYKHCGFTEAVEWLKAQQGSQAPPQQQNAPISDSGASGEALQPLAKDTWRKFAVPCPWLEARIPDAAVRERYGVFCYNNPARKSAYSGRVMLPVKDLDGQLYGYLGRAVNPSSEIPKYLFPKNLPKSHFLFGADVLKAGTFGQVPLKRIYLLESPFAVMKFASLGLPALSPYGWSVSPEQIATLKQLARGILYMPDRNKYSDSRGVVADIAAHLWVKAPPLPEGCDDPEQLDLPAIQALTH